MPSLEHRLFMFDPARQPERAHVYDDLLPLLAKLGYTGILWHFSDQEGCRITLPSHPELAGAHAWSADEMRRFIERAGEHGLTVIPELECLGHTRYVSEHPRFRHLHDECGGYNSSLLPGHPESLAVIGELIDDVASIFPAEHLHAGCDEVAFGQHPWTRSALLERGTNAAATLFCEHVNAVRDRVSAHGKRMWIWADHLQDQLIGGGDHLSFGSGSAYVREHLAKDVLLCDWYYGADVDPQRLEPLHAAGFETLACPSGCAIGTMLHPRAWNLDNIQRFTAIAHAAAPQCRGVINTFWAPGRCLGGALILPLLLGGVAMNDGDPQAALDACLATVFDGDDNPRFGRALADFAAAMPHYDVLNAALLPCNDAEAEAGQAMTQHIEPLAAASQELQAACEAARPSVDTLAWAFADLSMTAQLLATLCAGFQDRDGDRRSAQARHVVRLATILPQLEAHWDATRFVEDRLSKTSAQSLPLIRCYAHLRYCCGNPTVLS